MISDREQPGPRRSWIIVTRGGSPKSISALSEENAWWQAYLTVSAVSTPPLDRWLVERRAQGWKCLKILWEVEP